MTARVLEVDDVAALDALPIDAVVICRVREVFQVKRVPTALGDGTGRAWFALGYGDRVWSAAEVASWGPLTVLWPLPADVPTSGALDPRTVQLGAVVKLEPRAGLGPVTEPPLVGTFILWAPPEPPASWGTILVEVEGVPHRLRDTHYEVLPVR